MGHTKGSVFLNYYDVQRRPLRGRDSRVRGLIKFAQGTTSLTQSIRHGDLFDRAVDLGSRSTCPAPVISSKGPQQQPLLARRSLDARGPPASEAPFNSAIPRDA